MGFLNALSVDTMALVREMGGFLQSGIQQAAASAASDRLPDPDEIADRIGQQMSSWDPVINGRKVLDQKTRQACARFLSGIACNLTVRS